MTKNIFKILVVIIFTAGLDGYCSRLLAQTGTITGTVVFAGNKGQGRSTGLSALYKPPAEKNMHRPTDENIVVLFLRSFPGEPVPGPITGKNLEQKNMTFHPHTMVVTKGSTIGFPNMDNIYHNVFSFSKAKTFDLGRYAQGKTKMVTFDKPGLVEVFCEIHSHMKANIIVVPNKFYTIADENNRFTISGVPKGTYTLAAWSESYKFREYSVTVPENGAVTVTVEF